MGVSTLAALALVLVLLEVELGQSFAMWLGWPQNMQSFSFMHCWCSSSVNLPSFLRWEGALGVVDFEVPEELEELLLLLLKPLLLLSFSLDLPLELEELAGPLQLELEKVVAEFLVWHSVLKSSPVQLHAVAQTVWVGCNRFFK